MKKISYLPYQAHSFAFGGFEVQMLNTYKASKANGINVELLNIWDREVDFDILHCWGLGLAHSENIYWAKKNNKKVIVTALLSYYENWNEKIRFYTSSLVYKQRIIKEMLVFIDKIVVLNDLQAAVCTDLYKILPSKIAIIPNVVDDVFFSSQNTPVINDIQNSYILIVGNVCERKNQLRLAQACADDGIPLVIIGKCIEGESAYGNQLEKLVNQHPNITWVKGLKENSLELLNFFKNSFAVALPSFVEQQPISLLEGGVLNKPLIISDKAFGLQKYYGNASLVSAESVSSIKAGIKRVIKSPDDFKPNPEVLKECSGISVANEYDNLYNLL